MIVQEKKHRKLQKDFLCEKIGQYVMHLWLLKSVGRKCSNGDIGLTFRGVRTRALWGIRRSKFKAESSGMIDRVP